MSGPPVYVLDANVFIEAARRYYAFDLVSRFWEALIECAQKGLVLSIDRVKAELDRGNDALATWADNSFHPWFTSTAESEVVDAYAQVMVWAQGQTQFTEPAKALFAKAADGWLVAYARAKGCLVVTHEQFDPDTKKRVPIPNCCRTFGVQYVDTFQMLRALGVKLS
ncbi:MAG: DUF4411 family protein [Actinomycetota bacterium]